MDRRGHMVVAAARSQRGPCLGGILQDGEASVIRLVVHSLLPNFAPCAMVNGRAFRASGHHRPPKKTQAREASCLPGLRASLTPLETASLRREDDRQLTAVTQSSWE